MMSRPEFIRDLPPDIKEKLSGLLDENKAWERMVMRFIDVNINVFSIEDLKHESYPSSPARKLIKLMNNFKLSDVYVTLATLEMTSAMKTIADHVDPETRGMVEGAKPQSAHNETRISYIYELPEETRIELCQVLDSDGSWQFLLSRFEGAGLHFWALKRCEQEKNSSPSYEFLKLLADRNLQISILYTALASLNLRKAMSLLEGYENLRCKIQPHLKRNEPQDAFNKISNIGSATGKEIAAQPSSNVSSHHDLNAGRPHCTTKFQRESSQLFSPRGASSNGITYRELQVATHGWNEDNRLTSKETGKFYRGILNGTEVAIKKLQVRDRDHCNEVLEELRILRLANHRNIHKISRIIEGGDTPCVIYPFVNNKSLYDHLSKRSTAIASTESSFKLTWQMKYNIAAGIVDALKFLHSCFNCAVVVKSSDILLNDKMDPLVADICLPCMLSENPSKDLGLYLPAKKRKGNQNFDSFCFGTIVLELAMGKTADSLGMHPSTKMKKNKIDFDEVEFASDEVKKNWSALVAYCFEADNITCAAKAVQFHPLHD